jgi:two-component system chemotaxis response regulator CheB
MRAVLVEDSTVQAAALARMLEADGDIEVVATAVDVAAAADAVALHRPDVVAMDLDIPGGGGQHAIERIMAETPTPILVVSGMIASAQAAPAVRALAAGAVDALPKPTEWGATDADELRRHVRRVGRVPVIRRRPPAIAKAAPAPLPAAASTGGLVLAIAASTGGPAALASLLVELADCGARILVVQHIHPAFVEGFADWLTDASGIETVIARDGDHALAGRIHIAPGDCHLRLAGDGRLDVRGAPETLHRPSADELFRSVARHGGRGAVGVQLTGMGEDGAAGLLAMREAGARTFAQDEASSAVYGMPRAASRMGAAESILPLEALPTAIRLALRRGS